MTLVAGSVSAVLCRDAAVCDGAGRADGSLKAAFTVAKVALLVWLGIGPNITGV
jgi:hypothetical protein